MYDVIIVGNGPAGISASLYTVRGKLKTLVIGLPEQSAIIRADKIDNYYGFAETINGKELYETGIKQAQGLGVEMVDAEVIGIEKNENFLVKTTMGDYESKTVLLATGSPRKNSGLKDEKRYNGKGISYCAVCDGFFYRDKAVGVIGDGDYALSEANELSHVTSKVYVFTNGKPPSFEDSKYKVITEKIKAIVGENSVEGVELVSGEIISVEGLFVAVGKASATDFARKMGVIFEDNDIKVNNKMQTNLEGLFAAGDCVGGFLQISKSVGEGAVAAKSIMDYVRKNI